MATMADTGTITPMRPLASITDTTLIVTVMAMVTDRHIRTGPIAEDRCSSQSADMAIMTSITPTTATALVMEAMVTAGWAMATRPQVMDMRAATRSAVTDMADMVEVGTAAATSSDGKNA